MLSGISMKVITTENRGLPCCADAATPVLEKPSDPLHEEFFLPKTSSGERLFTLLTRIRFLTIADAEI